MPLMFSNDRNVFEVFLAMGLILYFMKSPVRKN